MKYEELYKDWKRTKRWIYRQNDLTEKKFREWIGERIGTHETSTYKKLFERWKSIMKYEEGREDITEIEFKKWINTQMMW